MNNSFDVVVFGSGITCLTGGTHFVSEKRRFLQLFERQAYPDCPLGS